MLWLYISLGVLGVIILPIFFGALYGYNMGFYLSKKDKKKRGAAVDFERFIQSSERVKQLIKDFASREYEEITITSFDGTMLHGKYFHIKDGAPLQIQFHGYKGNAFRDFCGGNQLALNLEHNTLVVDQRAHGKSGGHTITMGLKEGRDCACWAKYANERFGSNIPIFLVGVSMGGATVLMASELDLPQNVVGIIADCPFSNGPEMVKRFITDMDNVPKSIAYPFAYLGALIFGRFNLNKASARDAVKNTSLPIIILHGTADTVVPYEMATEIFESCSSRDKFIYSFDGADHGMSFMVDPEKYTKATNDFIGLCINNFEKAKN